MGGKHTAETAPSKALAPISEDHSDDVGSIRRDMEKLHQQHNVDMSSLR